MAAYPYIVADVFTDTPLQGNPVAVFFEAAAGLTTAQMQKIAREMHLSETVFALPPEKDGDLKVRIFGPTHEMAFAGHPLLGTAIIFGNDTHKDNILIETGMGTISIQFDRANDGKIINATMNQPIPTWQPCAHQVELLAGLGLTASTLPVEVYCNGPKHVYIGLNSPTELAALSPNLNQLARLPDMGINCFAQAGDGWHLRMFGPAHGVDEDAATGSAAGPLAVHLARHGFIRFGDKIEIHQGLQIARPSKLIAIAYGDKDQIHKVEVSGAAVIIIRATLFI